MMLRVVGFVVGGFVLLMLFSMIFLDPMVYVLLFVALTLISLRIESLRVCICDLYLSFIHVGATAYSDSIYEVRLYLHDILGLLNTVVFDEPESFIFPCGCVLQAIC